MKIIIAGIVVIIALAAVLFVTPVYAPCMEGPGINCNGYPPQTLTQIKSDMLNYAITDKPHITMDGTPHIAVHLEVDDASSNIMFEHDFNLSSYGNASYALDISSYKPGVYSATATSLMSKVTISFSVGLTTMGPPITLNVSKNMYVQGDFITIVGTVGPDDAVQLSLIDPNDKVVTSIQTVSNDIGQYSTSALRIPTNAVSGTWKITADHNTSDTTLKILVQSLSSNEVMKNNDSMTSPLEQFKSGIKPTNTTCQIGLALIFKSKDNSPACVKPDTVSKLVFRGWSVNPMNDLLLKYANQTQANLIFYGVMNDHQVRNWSATDWKYNFYDSVSDGEKHTVSATVHLYLPANEKNHPECKNGSQAFVVMNLKPKPVEIESNMTEIGCIPDFIGGDEPGLNKK